MNGVQSGSIELGPGIGGGVETADASIVAVRAFAVRVECGGVVIDMRPTCRRRLMSVQATHW